MNEVNNKTILAVLSWILRMMLMKLGEQHWLMKTPMTCKFHIHPLRYDKSCFPHHRRGCVANSLPCPWFCKYLFKPNFLSLCSKQDINIKHNFPSPLQMPFFSCWVSLITSNLSYFRKARNTDPGNGIPDQHLKLSPKNSESINFSFNLVFLSDWDWELLSTFLSFVTNWNRETAATVNFSAVGRRL